MLGKQQIGKDEPIDRHVQLNHLETAATRPASGCRVKMLANQGPTERRHPSRLDGRVIQPEGDNGDEEAQNDIVLTGAYRPQLRDGQPPHWNDRLGVAAQAHSEGMDQLSHDGSEGESVADRLGTTGHEARARTNKAAAGQPDATTVAAV